MARRFLLVLLVLHLLIIDGFSQESQDSPAAEVPGESGAALEISGDSAGSTGSDDIEQPGVENEIENEQEKILGAYFHVEGLNQWQYEYDISTLDEGVYNLIVRGIDTAGNEVESNAVDILIDPDSDLPVASLTYPGRNMRVSGNLNILGSAEDDDGIEFIEVSLDEGEFIRIPGSEFWSYDLPTADLPDGRYTLTVRAADINGVVGNDEVTGFHIDRKIPEITVVSHSSGDLVSGKITIEGTIDDSNGLKQLLYSTDGGVLFEPAKLSGDYREGTGEFSISIDTRELADGPGIIWFDGTDSQGSSGRAAILLYIDNEAPKLDFLYPGEDSGVNGRFSIMGRALDQVGLASLEYSFEDEEASEILLEPGNPYWKIDVDFTGKKKAEILFVLKDIAGNVEKFPFKLDLDWEGDLPHVEVYNPENEGTTDKERFQGVVIDDDGPAGITWSLDKGEAVYVESGRFFDIPLEGLAAGEHSLAYHARDKHGIEGVERVITFSVVPEQPRISIDFFRYKGGGEEPFETGMTVRPDEIAGIRGTVFFDSGKGSGDVLLSGGERRDLVLKKGGEEGSWIFTADFPEPAAFGYFEMEVTARDDLGSEAVHSDYFWMENHGENLSGHGFYIPGKARENFNVDDRDGKVILRYVGYPLTDLIVAENADFLNIDRTGNYITITGKEAGVLNNLNLVGKSDRGIEFSSDSISIISDLLPPSFIEITPDSGSYRGRLSIGGKVTDDSGKPELFYRIGAGEDRSVRLSEVDDGFEFSFIPDVTLFSGGGEVLTLTARDSSGRETVVRRAYQIPQSGAEPPPVKMFAVSPVKDEVVFSEKQTDEMLLAAAGFTGLESVSRLTWSIDGGEASPVTGFPLGSVQIPLPDPGLHTITFRAEYGEAKTLTASRRFSVIPPPGVLSLDSSVTGEKSVPFVQGSDLPVQSGTVLRGSITGSGKYPISTVSIDGGEPQTLRLSAGEEGLSFQIPMKDFVYGRHDIHIEVEDAYGRNLTGSYFFFALEETEGRVMNTDEGIYPLSVKSGENFFVDPGDNIAFYFNGRTIESAALTPDTGSYSVSFSDSIIRIKADTVDILTDEILEVRTIDGDIFTYGPFGISSDTTPPELTVVTPETGGYYRDTIILSGSLTDDFAVEGLEYSLQGGAYKRFESRQVSINAEESVTETEADTEADSGKATGESDGGKDPRIFNYSGDIDLSGLKDGPVHLNLKSSDRSGNFSATDIFFIKDTTPPEIIQILPENNESINGRFSFMFRGEDEWTEDLSGEYIISEEVMETYEGEDSFSFSIDLSSYNEIPESFGLSLADTSGNQADLKPGLLFQPEGDIPEVQIQIPGENSLVQSDFTVSGTIFDDDGVERIEYQIDGGDVFSIPVENSFTIPVSIAELSDNEHLIEIKAFDLWGVESETVSLNFRVSLSVPEAEMLSPVIGKSNKGVISLSGTAGDANGIAAVYLSLDNGNSFNRAEGAEEWTYELDTRVLVDGNYMIQIRVEDNYGVSAVYSSLLTIDNTPPSVQLSSPLDGMGVTDFITLQMRTSDEIGIEELKYTIRPLGELDISTTNEGVQSVPPEEDDVELIPGEEIGAGSILEGNLRINEVVIDRLDLNTLRPGRYNLSVFAYDDAGNETVVSRNILRKDLSRQSVPRILFPFQGTEVHGEFILEGRIEGDYYPPTVILKKNGSPLDVLEVNSGGYFYRHMLSEELEPGQLEFQVVIQESADKETESSLLKIKHSSTGPWVRIDSVRTGEYVRNRPWIEGEAGYLFEQTEEEESKETEKGRKIEILEYSLDNGRTFTEFRARNSWKFRLETQTLQDGPLGILVRAGFHNGETAVTQLHVMVDDTPPSVSIVTPEEGLAFNESLVLNGIASDENGLSDVSVMLRKGSKNSYEIPSFIQGLFVDGHFMGITYWEIGAGLTFFDDNVKIQALFGMSTPGRFDGNVFGVKLLANVATIPYGYYFGPDWDFLSSSFAVGASFQYFTMSGDNPEEENSGLVLGALVGQIELIKVKFRSLPFLNTYSLYFEDQLWFVSSDVQGGIFNRAAFGFRINVF